MDIRLAQTNPRVGDLEHNLKALLAAQAAAPSTALVVTSELALCGYPPQDLLDWPLFVDRVAAATLALIQRSGPGGLLFGTFWKQGSHLFNGAVLAAEGREIGRVAKRLLPAGDVFDERRWFTPGPPAGPLSFRGWQLGVHICEDGWMRPELWPDCPYTEDPVADLVRRGADVLINLSASPWARDKAEFREALCRAHAMTHARDYILVNQVGGNDELIFDGGSLHLDARGEILVRAPLFEQGLVIPAVASWSGCSEQLFQALVLGVRDYFSKTGFRRAVLGLSGGIDSALVLLIAVEALGAANVTAVAMPGPYSSPDSLGDAARLAAVLGVSLWVSPIDESFAGFSANFEGAFQAPLEGLARQNAQSRLRGLTLLTLANSLEALVLATGNKSELATGYGTLGGDLVGALSVIGDLLKGEVQELVSWWGRGRELEVVDILKAILEKAPSAELAPEQTDQDTLPPYPELDRFVEDLVCRQGNPARVDVPWELAERARWARTLDRSEYKRRLAPPVLKVTAKAFGRGRRRPLAQGFDPGWNPEA